MILSLARLLVGIFIFLGACAHADDGLSARRYVPVAQSAATVGNLALWHNPAGLAFMGGSETSLQYLYEYNDLGNLHHGGLNLAANFWQHVTLAGGINSHAAFADNSRANRGSALSGIIGAAIKLGDQASFGIAFNKSHNFLSRMSTPTLVSFGLQLRPFSFLSFGGHYQEVSGDYFAAPNITAAVAIRPYKEYLTFGFDHRFEAKSTAWSAGFSHHPSVSLIGNYRGYGAGVSAEFPGLPAGFKKPVFSFLLDVNFAHLGISATSVINAAKNNYAVGGSVRSSSEEWSSVIRHHDLWVELTIDHDGNIEHQPRSLAEKLFSPPQNPLAVFALLKRIEKDASVAHVELKLNGFNFGDARTQEWRNAVEALRNAGKEVIVYLNAPSERDYYIASAANKIHMNKFASLSFSRFRATLVYYAEVLSYLGIKAEAVAAGSYKTAPRQWTNEGPSKEEVEVANTILNSFYETMLHDVEKARNIDRAKLKALFDHGEITATQALQAGLIDEIKSPVEDDEKKPVRMVFDGYEHRTFKREQWQSPKKIVVIPIVDTISSGRATPGMMSWLFPFTGDKDVIDEIEEAVDDDDVAGIIVRIDSPGGDAMAGHRINEALMLAKKSKPVVTSMSDVAASAGYLIAAGSDDIFALPNTITGSIGVFSLMFSGEKLAKTIGINTKELSPLKNPGPTMYRGLSAGERKEAERITDWFYENFIESVSIGLNMSKDDVHKVADGRVWLGHEALEKKLVHELGGFSQAVESVRTHAKIPADDELIIDVRTPGQSQQFSFTTGLMAMLSGKAANDDDKNAIANIASPYLKALEAYKLNAVPQARLPFSIEWQKRHH